MLCLVLFLAIRIDRIDLNKAVAPVYHLILPYYYPGCLSRVVEIDGIIGDIGYERLQIVLDRPAIIGEIHKP